MTESINCVCGHPREEHEQHKRKSAGWYCDHQILVYAENHPIKCPCTEYRPEQPNIDTSGEREARAIALRNYIENDQTPLVTTEFQFNAGWDAGSAYSKAQVIDEFVRRLNQQQFFPLLRQLEAVAEEMKKENEE